MVIRAHGISPVERKKLIDNAFNIVDGTCAKVLRSQEIISRYSSEDYFILIAGDLGHAEVLALQGCAEQSLVITSAEQVIPLKLHEKTLLIAQTTFSVEEYDKISTALGKKGIPFMVEKTICGDTESRQKALDDLLPNIDALVVIGGLSSANTTRLYQRGLEMGKPSFLIEGPEDLDLNALEPYGIIGISAGASTPNGIIDETMDLLEDF
ncbi:MAG: 4-hydroxy-3-methylbut-2-enyl diphosphate reductase, partial [Spirochaetaceae bacterium]|jgi:(E)-4-hydroxy-3-methyl-but-2-enyl pyrophosphate reductase|nr:4-hydroxy-3-methylbut-2-enyl diphosphate reductase [Spirochaetaceae bacterium]